MKDPHVMNIRANALVREGVLYLRDQDRTRGRRKILTGISVAKGALVALLRDNDGLRSGWRRIKREVDDRIPFDPRDRFRDCIYSGVDLGLDWESIGASKISPDDWSNLACIHNTIGHACIMYSFWGREFDFRGIKRRLRRGKVALHYAVQLLLHSNVEKLWRQVEVNCGIVLLLDGMSPLSKVLFGEAMEFFTQSSDVPNRAVAEFWLLKAKEACPGIVEMPPNDGQRSMY